MDFGVDLGGFGCENQGGFWGEFLVDLNEAILVRNLRNPHMWKSTGNSPEFSPEFSPLFFRRFSHVLYWPRPSVASQRFIFTSSWHFVRAFRLGASSWRFVLAFRPSLVPALRPSVSSQPCSHALRPIGLSWPGRSVFRGSVAMRWG